MNDPQTWNLTAREADTLDAVLDHGKVPEAAKALGIEASTARAHIHAALRKAKAKNIVLLALAWDRYSRPISPKVVHG